MQIWSNTKTLDGYIPGLTFTQDKAQAEIALVGGKAIDLREFPKLRGIFKTGVGRDNVPEADAKESGVVCEFPSAATSAIIYEETANFACHLVLKCLYAEVGDFASWKKSDRPALATREVLVLGTGNIGGRVAAKLKCFVKVTTFDVMVNTPEELEPLVRRADCITLHIPFSPATRDFFDATKLSWMKDKAALVNTARAAVVTEEALQAELASGRIRAAFDVFWQEPYQGKLRDLPPDRFMVTPHIASTCREFLAATADDFRNFIKNLEDK
ncbi:MAG TPA: NAD(P)-dependent oxidoreductase [Verrucomicrobiota bacterium]|nr:hydroxyacid dehydrogenase [Verrucomicrobiales bacterium]HRI11744.1 NAD(P)-dependent oxidoreductase [Verrucomicrobiota bacterium]